MSKNSGWTGDSFSDMETQEQGSMSHPPSWKVQGCESWRRPAGVTFPGPRGLAKACSREHKEPLRRLQGKTHDPQDASGRLT